MGGPKGGYSAADWGIALVIGAVFFVGMKSCSSDDSKPKELPEPTAIVSNSSWDASVKQVKEYLKRTAKDASSIEYLEWSTVRQNANGTFSVRVKYRAKNSFGAHVTENRMFLLSRNGEVLSESEIE